MNLLKASTLIVLTLVGQLYLIKLKFSNIVERFRKKISFNWKIKENKEKVDELLGIIQG